MSSKDVKRLFLTDVADHISQEALTEGSRLVPAGAVFVVVRGMALAKDIPVAMAMVPMAFNQDIKALVPGNAVAPEFLLFSLKAHKDRLMREVGTAAHGTRRMAGSAIEDFTIPLPPLAEQRATAAALRSVYEAVPVQEKIVAGLRELKAATMAKLFREGLRGERRKQTEIGEIPKSWEVVRLSAVAAVATSSVAFSRLEVENCADPAALEVLGLKVSDMNRPGNETHIHSGATTFSLPREAAERLAIRPGAIVFPKRGAAIATNKKRKLEKHAVLDPNLIAVVAGSKIHPDFLFQWFQAFDLSSLQQPGTVPQLNKKDLEPILVPLPEPDEQRAFVRCFGSLDGRIAVAQNSLSFLRALFSSTLHLLMTGQVRVPVSKEA